MAPMRIVCFLFSLQACGNILGLEEAHVDPLLEGESVSTAASTGTSSSGGSTTAGGVTTSASGGAPAPCQSYCDTVMENCADAFAVYVTIESCMAVCAQLPVGREGDTTGNSVHCRLHSAENAPNEPTFYCPIAGPGGQGVCGSNCEALCGLAENVCVGALDPWPNDAACATECAGVPDLGTYSTSSEQQMYKGDNVQCRLFHISAAAVDDPSVHCAHVAGMPPCAPPSEGGSN
jgi:hypothetical protein